MVATPRISLEQWRSLLAVVDAGGYAQAAEVLHKSQSAVTYAVQKMESLLGVKVFEVVGRKAHLTPTGEVLYRRAKALLDEAGALEGAAGSLAAGWEPELRLAVEIIFPTWLLLQCFARFAEERPQTQTGQRTGHLAEAAAGACVLRALLDDLKQEKENQPTEDEVADELDAECMRDGCEELRTNRGREQEERE